MENINLHIQKAPQIPCKANSKMPTLAPIIGLMKDKREFWKRQEKHLLTCVRIFLIMIDIQYLIRHCGTQKTMG